MLCLWFHCPSGSNSMFFMSRDGSHHRKNMLRLYLQGALAILRSLIRSHGFYLMEINFIYGRRSSIFYVSGPKLGLSIQSNN